MTQRIKHCNVCNVDFPTMYRVQYKNPKEWVFVWEDCLLEVKANIPHLTLTKTTYLDISLICSIRGKDLSLVLDGNSILLGRTSKRFLT